MKKQIFKTEIPLLLLLIATLIIGSGCNPEPEEEAEDDICEYAVSYKVNGTLITHNEGVITSEIWSGEDYTVDKKVYDIWTDEAPGFNFHSSASSQDEVSTHVSNWQEAIGSTILMNTANLESDGLTFKVLQEASVVDDLLKISFSGTTVGGQEITEGLICTYIDTVHP